METTGKGDVTGIDIIQKCDYFTIGSAKRAYLDVGFFISQSFPAFRHLHAYSHIGCEN